MGIWGASNPPFLGGIKMKIYDRIVSEMLQEIGFAETGCQTEIESLIYLGAMLNGWGTQILKAIREMAEAQQYIENKG